MKIIFFENILIGVLTGFWKIIFFENILNGVLTRFWKMIFFENILNGVLTRFWKMIFFENILNGVLTGFRKDFFIKCLEYSSQRGFNGVCSKSYKISHFEKHDSIVTFLSLWKWIFDADKGICYLLTPGIEEFRCLRSEYMTMDLKVVSFQRSLEPKLVEICKN